MPRGNSGSLGSGMTGLAAVGQAEMVQAAEMVSTALGEGLLASPPQPGAAQRPAATAKPASQELTACSVLLAWKSLHS